MLIFLDYNIFHFIILRLSRNSRCQLRGSRGDLRLHRRTNTIIINYDIGDTTFTCTVHWIIHLPISPYLRISLICVAFFSIGNRLCPFCHWLGGCLSYRVRCWTLSRCPSVLGPVCVFCPASLWLHRLRWPYRQRPPLEGRHPIADKQLLLWETRASYSFCKRWTEPFTYLYIN